MDEEETVEELPDLEGLTPVRSLEELRSGPAARARLSPAEAIKRFWGFAAPYPLQERAVAAALAGRDALVVLPTGGGKSLCYQLPAACGAGTTLVVSPLIALMDDQVAAAAEAGLRAGALHSNLEGDRRRAVFRDAGRGALDLLYLSPERFIHGDVLEACAGHLGLIAVDEAHCVSHWGHDFRPEYRQLAGVFARAPGVPRMALTATATPAVQRDVVEQLELREPERVLGHPDRPNLIYRAAPRGTVKRQIMAVLGRMPGEGAIVYAQTRKATERIAAQLRAAGIDARAYHAGLEAAERRRIQADFVAERLRVVVATIAFGMGIDRSNVRCVIHANAPRSIEHYQQESGRAGRDGLPAECVLLFSGADLATHRALALKDGEPSPERRRVLERQLAGIGRFCSAPVCRHRLLSEHFGHALDHGPEGCGACDVCLGETDELPADEALVLAQKLISGVWRCGNRFGANHVIEVLRGGRGERLRRLGHDRLSTYGLLAEHPPERLRFWLDQLVVQDHLAQVERNGYPVLVVTPSGRALCRGEGELHLTVHRAAAPKKKARAARRPAAGGDELLFDEGQEALFQRLRALRRRIADALGRPPYVVFGDVALREMVYLHPRSPDELLACKGVGETKRERYGAAFLAVLAGAEPEDAAALVGTGT